MSNKILFFSSSSCGPCKLAKSMLTEEVVNNLDVEIKNISAENDFETFAEYKVASVPTFILVDDDVEIKRKVGFKNIKDLEDLIGN